MKFMFLAKNLSTFKNQTYVAGSSKGFCFDHVFIIFPMIGRFEFPAV